MAKKIDEIKEEMGFSKVAPMCGNCKHFTKEQEAIIGINGQEFMIDKRSRCSLGNFKVGKSNWCKMHEEI